MNNLEQKLKTLCHQNYIGSEKCGEKENKDCSGLDCMSCKGKGYTIPLEFGCDVKYGDRVGKIYRLDEMFIYIAVQDTDKKWNYTTDIFIEDSAFENLGKPLILQMVLRLLSKASKNIFNSRYFIDTNGDIWEEEKSGNIIDLQINIDLNKDLKDQPEVLQSIYNIVN